MGEVNGKNYVKDIENTPEVKNLVDDNFDFKAFDKKIEESFQTFLGSHKGSLENLTVQELQGWFNGWLDSVYLELDDMKDKEIEKKIIGQTTFELVGVSTVDQLLNLQDQVMKSKKEESMEEVTLHVEGGDLKMKTFDNIDPNKIVNLFNTKNFEKKEYLLDLLKTAKTKNNVSEEVKKFQRIIVGNKEDDISKDKSPDTKKLLGRTGVDGMFGDDTLAAFEKYVEEKKVETTEVVKGKGADNTTNINKVNAAINGNINKSGVSGGGDSQIDNGTVTTQKGKAANEVGSSTVGQSGSTVRTPVENMGTVGQSSRALEVGNTVGGNEVEVFDLDKEHEIKSLYEGKGGDTITIAKNLSGYKVEMMPYIVAKNMNFPVEKDPENPNIEYLKLDENGDIKYVLPNVDWEGTISIKLSKEGEDTKVYTITMKALEQKKELTPANLEKQVDELQVQEGMDENNEKIPAEIEKLKKRYKEIVNEKNEVKPEYNVEFQEMKKRMEMLYHAKEANILEGMISKIQDGTSIPAGKRYLNDMIIDNATIYIGGKYLTKEDFIKKVERIKKKLYKDLTIELPDDVWTRSTIGSAKITKLILTDDENFLKNNALGDEEIQYDAMGYVPMKDNETENKEGDNNQVDKSNEKKAIRKIIRGIDKSLSIADEYYKKNSFEKSNLQKLREGLMAIINSGVDTHEIFNFIAEKVDDNFKGSKKDWKTLIQGKYSDITGGQAGNIAKLGELYAGYKNNQIKKKMGDYFTKIMGLLENYFVRGVKKGDKDIDTFSGMYGNERIGVADLDLIDPDKQRKAINQLFKGGLLSEPYNYTPALGKLQQVVKNMDLVTFFAKPGLATKDHPNTDPEHMTSTEKKFNTEYKKYVQCLKDDEVDKNGKPKISEDLYYNAVFDFLVGVGESRSDIVSAINSLKLYSGGDISADVLEESGFDDANEMKLVCMISDINSDGRVDFKDRGYKMGLEIKNIYKDAKVDYNYGLLEKSPLQNLIEYATKYASMSGSVKIASQLQEITEYDPESLFKSVEGSTLLKYLQNLLVNSPADMIDNIFKYGGETYNEQLEITASQRAIQEIMDNEKFNETFEEQYKKLVEQGLKDTPEVKVRIKPIVAAGLLANITDSTYLNMDDDGNIIDATKSRELSWNPYAAVGLALSTEKAGDFTLSLGARTSIDNGDFDIETVGIGMSWGKSRDVGKKTKIGAWAAAGVEYSFHPQKPKFIPLASTGLQVSTLVNEKKLKQGLKAKASTYFDVGTSVGIGITGKDVIPFVEGHIGFSRDQIEGIETKYNSIKEQLGGDGGVIMDILNNVDFAQDETEWKYAIYDKLGHKFYPNKKQYNKEQDEALSKATDNIYNGILYYMVGTNLRDIADEGEKKAVKKGIADQIAEAYAVSRKNSAYQDLDGKVNLDQLSAGAMVFFLGTYPVVVPMIGFSVSRYRGLYSMETSASQKEYQKQLRTEGNAKQQGLNEGAKELYDQNDHITQEGINYINDKLQIANERVKVPQITFYEETDLENKTKTKGILLPSDLYKYVNINVKKKLEAYASVDAEGNLIVPENTIITLLTSSRTDTGKFDLIIGGKAVEDTDIVINRNINLSGDAESYEGDKGERILDIDKLNELMKQEIKREDFPIEKCEKVVYNGDNEPFALFKIKEGMSIKNMGGEYSKVTVDKGIISVPQTGTLTIYQTVGGEYQLFYQSLPVDDMKINYEVEGEEIKTYKEEKVKRERSVTELSSTSTSTIETLPPKKFNDAKDIYGEEFMNELNGVLANIDPLDVRNLLSEYNTPAWKLYTEFMDLTCHTNDNNVVDVSDYDSALDKLRKMLKCVLSAAKRNPNLKYVDLDRLNQFVNKNDLTLHQKVMVVDQCKMFFSYEANLTNGKGDGSDLKKLINKRGDTYKKLDGYVKSGVEFPLKSKDYRSEVLERLENRSDLKELNPVGNLLGMTAFYKVGTITKKQDAGGSVTTTKGVPQMTEGRGYSMTEMGNTTPLGGEMVDIESSDLSSTREWFWKNFYASEIHKDILEDTLLNRIRELIGENTDIDTSRIQKEHIQKILDGVKKGEEDIDIGLENIKISLDIDYVFYLLQECANESIGILLRGITIKVPGGGGSEDGEGGEDTIITAVTTREAPNQYTTTKKVTKKKGGAGIYTKSHVSGNELGISHKGGFGTIISGGARKITGPTTQGGMSEGHETTQGGFGHGHGPHN